MNEVRMPDFGASFAQVSSEATRRLFEQGQSIMQTMNEWNAEVSQFLSHRAARNGDPGVGRLDFSWPHPAFL
jgi:hypothetical protein